MVPSSKEPKCDGAIAVFQKQRSTLFTPYGNIFTEYRIRYSCFSIHYFVFLLHFLKIIDGRSATDSSVADEICVEASAMKYRVLQTETLANAVLADIRRFCPSLHHKCLTIVQ